MSDKPTGVSFHKRAAIVVFASMLWLGALTAFGQEQQSKTGKAVFDEAMALFNQGTAESYRAALEKFKEASRLYRDAGDPAGEAQSLFVAGVISDRLGEKTDTLKFYEEALKLFRAVANKSWEAGTLHNIGAVYYELGEKQKALDYFNQALPLSRAISDRNVEATTLNNIGQVYSDLGELQKALDYFNQALPLRRAVDDKGGEATTLTNIGTVYSALDEKQKVLEYYNQALPLLRAVSDKVGEARALVNIGQVYNDLGERQKALEYYNQALPLFKAVSDKVGEASTLNNIGGVYLELGELQKALDYFNQALPLRGAVDDKGGEAITLNNIGQVYYMLGERQKALEYYNQVLPLLRAVDNKVGEAIALSNIGAVYAKLGEKQKALDYFHASLPLSTAFGFKYGQVSTLSLLMDIWRNSNNPRFAVFYGKLAVNLLQNLRANIQGLDKQTQQTYLKSVEYNYRYLTDILIAGGRLAEAQQVLNTFKDQQFFDFDQAQVKQLIRLSLTPREADFASRFDKAGERVNKIERQLYELKRQIGNRQPSADEAIKLQQLEADLKTASDEFLSVLKQAEAEFSRPADDKDKIGDVPDLTQMQAALRELNRQTGQKAVAVYQLVGEDAFSALVILPDSIDKISVPVKGAELNEKAKRLWALLQSDKYDTTVLSKQIYDVVFAPLEAKLPKETTTTIMWSLDGNLRYVPMAALWDGNGFLVERYNHVAFTRTDTERMTRNVARTWTGTGFGSSNAQTIELLGTHFSFKALPGVKEELAGIFKNGNQGILVGETFPDGKFSRTSFLTALKQKRPLVHIASHFAFRPGDEARSFLLLGDGTAFTLEEIKREQNLFGGVELLTLSACNTAAQQAGANGREIDGFAELAQRLGAGAVMATLWRVSDASTPWLMIDFYSTRQSKTGISKTEALRQAQIALLKGTAETKPLPLTEKGEASNKVQIVLIAPNGQRDGNQNRDTEEIIYVDQKDAPLYEKTGKPPFAHPYYWSPFVLFGNWR